MAYLQADAIHQRLRELAEDGLGGVRTVAAGRFDGDLPDGLSNEEQRRRGLTARVEARIVEVRAHPQRLVQTGDVQYHMIAVELRVVRTLATETQVDDDLRDDVHALAIQDGDVLRQALEWPGNLHQTSEATPRLTGLLSLMHQRTRPRVVGNATGAAQHVETVHRFEGTALSRPAAA